MEFENKRLLFYKITFYSILFVFLSANWLEFIGSDRLACNDYYLYYFVSKKLFSFNLKLYLIPPLFPFLIGLLGRIFNLFISNIDSYILSGQLISLFSSIGVIIVIYKFFSKYSVKIALISTAFFIVSPFFLSLISTAQTDMLFLFFFSLTLYSFVDEKSKVSLFVGCIGGVLTRFEGILLCIAILFHYRYFIKEQSKKFILFLIPLFLSIMTFYFFFANRIFGKIELILSKKYYFLFLKAPKELAYLIYGNVFYFIPFSFPSFIKWSIFFVSLLLFILGLVNTFKKNLTFFIFTLIYLVAFIMFKGYAEKLDPNIEFRRWLSFIWLYLVIVIIGVYYFWCLLRQKVRLKIWAKKFPLIITAFIILFFFIKLYPIALGKVKIYHKNDTDIGSYKIAKWLNSREGRNRILVYTHYHMTLYYLTKNKNLKRIDIKDEKIYKNKQKLIVEFLKKAKKQKIQFIAFDAYSNMIENPALFYLKAMLFSERDKGKYFKVYKHFKYKGRYAGSVIIPIYESVKNMEI